METNQAWTPTKHQIWSGLILIAMLLVAACSSLNATPSPEVATPVIQPKILATLYISPTPNDQEQEATRLAVRAQPPTAIPSRTPAPTAYIGVFVGDAVGVDGGVPILDPSRFEGTLPVNLPTLGAPGCAYPVDPVFGTSLDEQHPGGVRSRLRG